MWSGFIFFLMSIAVWRISRLMAFEDGPKQLIFHFRRVLGAYSESGMTPGSLGDLLTCMLCLPVWISFFAVLLVNPLSMAPESLLERLSVQSYVGVCIAYVFALAGVSVALEAIYRKYAEKLFTNADNH